MLLATDVLGAMEAGEAITLGEGEKPGAGEVSIGWRGEK